ncbi:Fic family protein [Antrihabitans sp. YC3-6]|uniref:protein adenylyltransferase n=1 Tax=Antrihabitans stalagmiti TaxID=2799499 RepID=A0A934NVQ3_9NOCA|nr:Fic family protein [Antrihabitans stalagmiti]MBJ8342097.1 Fic family protein [Antrihabitans stalagmiti]
MTTKNSSDDLPDAVAQAIAAEALEGWRPTDENIADLVAVFDGRMSFGEYLGTYLTSIRAPHTLVRRRIVARRRPYLIPGTTVLRNNFGIEEAVALQQLEYLCTAARIVRLDVSNPFSVPDPHELHQQIFGDVYAWAGQNRITDLRRGDSAFATVDTLDARMELIAAMTTEMIATCDAVSDSEFAYLLARLYALYNHTHPFREGNGRTGTLYLRLLARRCGRRLDLTGIGRAEWIQASRDSMPFRRDGDPQHRPFLGLFGRAIRPSAS